ncbi:MAG TPA: hypothetical protein VGO30_24210 [Mycobacterium sp.]|nr:hypothetical protein [Mycobacterium sp.]
MISTADRLGFSGDVPRRIASLAYVVDADRRSALYADLVGLASKPDDVAGLRSVAMAAESLGDHARASSRSSTSPRATSWRRRSSPSARETRRLARPR